jgi:hypothetical protein
MIGISFVVFSICNPVCLRICCSRCIIDDDEPPLIYLGYTPPSESDSSSSVSRPPSRVSSGDPTFDEEFKFLGADAWADAFVIV